MEKLSGRTQEQTQTIKMLTKNLKSAKSKITGNQFKERLRSSGIPPPSKSIIRLKYSNRDHVWSWLSLQKLGVGDAG